MYKLIGYTKKIIKFRRKKIEVYHPIYKDLGKGKDRDKALKIDLKRET